eukprot:s1269_g8.t1
MSESSEGATSVPNQLAILVPSFDPSKDDLQVYTQKVELLLEAWPSSKYTELATRLILNCVGSAFKKLQLHQAEITKNERKSIQRIIELLGGHWGQIPLERRYEFAERALYKCAQKSDETADSYLARADIMWTELNNTKFQVSDLQAYVTLRGSMLPADDKKRVLIDADVADKGELTVSRVSAAIRMLGAGFFQEMTSGRKGSKLKIYDQATLAAEDVDETETEQSALATDGLEDDDQVMETLVQEGDEDATLVAGFEAAATEILQNDDELAAAFTAYQDARRRLNDKVRSRGFWPIAQKGKHKGSNKGVKGKFQKGHNSSRKSLQQRILESRCRLCGRMGHWKAECPSRNDQSSSASRGSQAPTTFVHVSQAGSAEHVDGLPLEFLNLPMHEDEPKMDATQHNHQFSFVTTTVTNTKSKLHRSLQAWHNQSHSHLDNARNDQISEALRARLAIRAKGAVTRPEVKLPSEIESDEVCFASHGCLGIVDLGATKTVIGSNLVKELLDSLHPKLRSQVFRCPCEITFRFGNHGVLQSKFALVIPIHGLHLKVAIVPGSTPFLLSSTLLRALSATIDTEHKVMFSRKLNREFPLQLTSKGLFLLDLNMLAQQQPGSIAVFPTAEMHPAIAESTDQHLPDTKRSHVKAMSSLAQRLKNLQKPVEENKPDLSHLSLGQLRETKICFGQTHRGKSFLHMWQCEQGWITWFVQRFSQSTKAEHLIFLRYVELEIERTELSGERVPLTNQKDLEKVLSTPNATVSQTTSHGAKAKAKSSAPQGQVPMPNPWEDDEDADLFELLPQDPTEEAKSQQIEELQNRMLNAEAMLGNILQHLENLTARHNTEQ